MNLDALKARIVADRIQVALIDRKGTLISSCDTLLPLLQHLGSDVMSAFFFLSGLEEAILGLQVGDPAFAIPCIEFESEGETYSLNMEFWAFSDEEIIWMLTRNDQMLPKVSLLQQERNDSQILLDRIQEQEQMLKENNERLESLNRRLDTFAYNVAHDLKAPLRAIQNLSTWIGEAVETGETEALPNYIQLMNQRVERMDNLIGGILTYSRTSANDQIKERVDTGELIQEIIASECPEYLGRISLPAKLPVLLTSRAPLLQVFSNLISNAVKYAGGPAAKIDVEYALMDGMAQFTVRDNGPGIAPQHHALIFDIFQTVDKPESLANTGIGLAIAKKVIEEAGGRIHVESAPGQGAAFVFTWPMAEL